MSKSEQVILIDPQHELKFKGPFTEAVTSFMKLTNPSDRRICFKIKTTAPKKYCVRPNSGILEPKGSAEVAVSLQPFDYDPNERNKHKFMVQTMYAPDGEVNMDTLWKDVDPGILMDSKLKCVFEVPIDTSSTQNNLDVSSPADDKKRTVDIKSSPKTTNMEQELKKAADEVRRLRDQESSLRQENIQLKEEVLRVRRSGPEGKTTAPSYALSPSATNPPTNTMMVVAMAFVVLLIGIVLGKYTM